MAPEPSLQSLIMEKPHADGAHAINVRDTLSPLHLRGKFKPFYNGKLPVS